MTSLNSILALITLIIEETVSGEIFNVTNWTGFTIIPTGSLLISFGYSYCSNCPYIEPPEFHIPLQIKSIN